MGSVPGVVTTARWCRDLVAMACAASRSRAPGTTSLGPMLVCSSCSKLETSASKGVPALKACRAQRGVSRACTAPPSAATRTPLCWDSARAPKTRAMLSLGLQVGTSCPCLAKFSFATIATTVGFSPASMSSTSERSSHKALTMSSEERTPWNPPPSSFTTTWWQLPMCACAMSIMVATSVSGTTGRTSMCRGSCASSPSSQWLALSPRAQPSTYACMRSFSVRIPFRAPSLSTTTAAVHDRWAKMSPMSPRVQSALHVGVSSLLTKSATGECSVRLAGGVLCAAP
mmetsp:Transcript_12519/g.34522  ORF Transcript_12519/g.34522 Transcript_12519/m.34522 type:complete len:286 (+) Transcript_12519:166-1023(+)